MAQMCFGLSGGFGPTIRPRFHETRVFVSLLVMVSSFRKLTRLIPSGLGRESRSRASSCRWVWLKGQVTDGEGKLDLNWLYEVAARYGIGDIERDKSLNPGQQRMSIRNRLRSLVPQAEYDHAARRRDPSARASYGTRAGSSTGRAL